MLNSVLNLQRKKQILGRGYDITISGEFSFSANPLVDQNGGINQIARIICLTLRGLKSPRSFIETYGTYSEEQLDPKTPCMINMRGRPIETFTGITPAPQLKEGEEELCYLDGAVEINEQDEDNPNEQQSVEIQTMPFTYQLKTRFSHFPSSRQIAYALHTVTAGPEDKLAQPFFFLDTNQHVPIRLLNFRVGCELFRSRFLGSVFGFSPVVKKRLYLELKHDGFRFYLQEEMLPDNNSFPFKELEVMPKLLHALNEAKISSTLEEEINARFISLR